MLPPMPSKDASAFLKTSPVFAGLPAREIEALGAVTVEETHRPREYIFMEGDPARWFCVVKSGHVKILRHSRAGKDVVLELLGPGEVFGGVAVIERRPYPAAAQATDSAVVLKIPAETMIAVSERHPSLIRELALLIGRRLRAAHDSVTSLAVDPVEARLAAALLRLADREGTPAKPGRHDRHHGRDRDPDREPLAQGRARAGRGWAVRARRPRSAPRPRRGQSGVACRST